MDKAIDDLFEQIGSSIGLLRDCTLSPPSDYIRGSLLFNLRKLESQVAALKKEVALVVVWVPEPKMGIGDFSIDGKKALKMQEAYAKRQKEVK